LLTFFLIGKKESKKCFSFFGRLQKEKGIKIFKIAFAKSNPFVALQKKVNNKFILSCHNFTKTEISGKILA